MLENRWPNMVNKNTEMPQLAQYSSDKNHSPFEEEKWDLVF